MELLELLEDRIGKRQVECVASMCSGCVSDKMKAELFTFVTSDNERVGYNALWIFTHMSRQDLAWLLPRRNDLIDRLLSISHIGQQRLILTLLDSLALTQEDLRTDYLDFCISGINSTKPYAIRALCLKQAFMQCRLYPDLMNELKAEIEEMENGEMSPGLQSVRRRVLKMLSKES